MEKHVNKRHVDEFLFFSVYEEALQPAVLCLWAYLPHTSNKNNLYYAIDTAAVLVVTSDFGVNPLNTK